MTTADVEPAPRVGYEVNELALLNALEPPTFSTAQHSTAQHSKFQGEELKSEALQEIWPAAYIPMPRESYENPKQTSTAAPDL
jgi:hypothetical protein